MYIIRDIIEEDGRFIVRIADPWANAPNLMEDEENNGIYDINYDLFIESFNKLLLVKVKPDYFSCCSNIIFKGFSRGLERSKV